MNNNEVDVATASKELGKYIDNGTLFEAFPEFSTVLKVIKEGKINITQGTNLLEQCRKLQGMHHTIDVFRGCNIDFGDDIDKVMSFTLCAHKTLKSRPFKSLNAFIAHLNDVIKALRKDIADLQAENMRLKQQNTSSDDGMIKMGSLLQDLISGNANIKKDLQSKEEELRELRMLVAIREKNVRDKKLKINMLNETIKQKDEKIKEMKDKLDNKNEELTLKNDQITKFEAQIVELKKLIPEGNPAKNSNSHKDMNLDELKACKKDSKFFDKIYGLLSKCSKETDTKCLKYAVNNGYVNIKDNHGMNVILKAADKGNFLLVKSLHEAGADIYARDKDGWSVLHQFCQSGCLDGVKYSLQYIDVNDTTNNRWTPLHIIAYYGRVQCAEYLCNLNNIKKNEYDDKKRTPLKLAQMNCEHVVAEILRWYGCTI